MNDSAPLLAVALLALLVGAALPVFYQLHQFLRRARAVLDSTAPRLDSTLERLGEAVNRLNGLGTTLEKQAHALSPLWEAASGFSRWVDRTGRWFGAAATVGGAVGPAVMAGVRALFSRPDERPGAGGRPARRRGSANGHDDQESRVTQSGDAHEL